ncbi:MAG: hypothetical protein K8S16_21985 [Bacteroidales bacterium]|nr:hypothetical protein [Bacteroidales bacterium]
MGKQYRISLYIFILILFSHFSFGQIHSNPTGGNWSDPATWIGGLVPGADTSIVINGPVYLDINTQCDSIYISSSGYLQNHQGNTYDLTINGNIINDGFIGNNVFNLLLYIHGNITQNGIWENFYTGLLSPDDQTLEFNQPFGGSYLNNTNTAGKILASGWLEFDQTSFDMNNDTLYFEHEAGIIMNGSFLDQAKVLTNSQYSENTFIFQLTDNAVFQKSSFTADTIMLEGTIQFQSGLVIFNGTVINEGIFQNHHNNSYSAVIEGSFINLGTVKDNVYKLTLSISGDIYNYGVWTSWATNLSGADDQNLFFYSPVSINDFVDIEPAGKIIARTDLDFNNSTLNFMDDTLVFTDGKTLSLSNSTLENLIIQSTEQGLSKPFTINGIENAHIHQTKIFADTIVIKGYFHIGSNPVEFHGTVFNFGILQNQFDNFYTITFIGDLFNNSTIKNNQNGNGLDVDINKNMTQNGTWENRTTSLIGTNIQTLFLRKEFAGEYLIDNNPSSSLALEDKIVFIGTGIDLGGSVVQIPDYSMIYIKQGYITNCEVQSTVMDFALLDDSWCANITLPETRIYGNCQVKNNVEFLGDVYIKGSLQNHFDGNYELTFPADLYNHGGIHNNLNTLKITLAGNLFNNGDINNESLILSGSTDQGIQLQNGNVINGALMFYTNSADNFEWHKDGLSLASDPEFAGVFNDTLTFLSTVTDNKTGTYNCLTGMGWSRNIIIDTINNQFRLDINVLLQGPFEETEMATGLNTLGQLPLFQPYNCFPWYYPGSESVILIPGSNVVDWILVELKESPNAASANQSKIFDKMAVLLLNDGSVVDLDGSSNLTFYRDISDSMYVNIIHRNHLSIMSASGLSEQNSIYNYDFIADSLAAFGGEISLQKLSSLPQVKYGMISGDANSDGAVNETDYEDFWIPFVGRQIFYDPKDLNFDCQVNNRDKNDAWFGNTGKTTQIPE